MRDHLAFLRGFLRHPREVGSIVPSSGFLERRLARAAGLADARCVVELGPGTGGTTRALLRTMPASASLLAIELSASFAHRLASAVSDTRLQVAQGSAERIAGALAERGLPSPDAVVSGIPFSTMPPEVARRIAAEIAATLRPGGRFVAYQVRANVSGFVTPLLGVPLRERELLNIPPMQLFTWTKRG